ICRPAAFQYSCQTVQRRTCTVSGDPHYYTFDNSGFHFQGTCTYILSEQCQNGLPYYRVEGKNEHRGSTHVSWTRLVKVFVHDETIELVKGRYGEAKVTRVDGQLIRLPFSSGSNRIRIFQSSTHSVILRTTFGVTLQTVWPHFVRVTAPGVYSGLLGGLCGNYNADQHDDFLLTSPTGPLTSCWAAVNPWQQVDACVEILQGSSDPASTLCEVLRDYALMCQHNELTCPSNSHYELCGSSCPSSCPSLSFPFTCDTQCQEGCQCNDGFVLNGNQCVPPTSCGCFHDGRYRQAGEQFWDGEECQSFCTCNGVTGIAQCSPNFGCHPNPHGTCSASGDPHYLTFDGKAYDFQGTCRYVLATVCNDTVDLHQFSVKAKNEPWFGLPVSITAEVYVDVLGYEVQTCPFISSLSVSLSLSVQNYLIFIRENMCGLCGNFNGNPNDDFHTPSGALSNSADAFGAAWKVPGNYTCSDGCGSSCAQCNDDRLARAQCEVIQAADGPFSFCHEEVDPAPYFSDCVFDVCVSGNRGSDLLCRALETYVSACQSANVRVYPWRQNTTCSEYGRQCAIKVFNQTNCGHTCASSIDAACDHVCSEGCFCDEGYSRSGTSCVPVESCGCQYDGFYFNAGESFWTEGCSQRCECQAPNVLICSPSSCTPAQECTIRDGHLGCYDAMSTCTVWGDPHYVTFDGALAHFQGSCSYIITETLRHSNNETQYKVVATNKHRGNNLVSFVSSADIYLSNPPESVHVRLGPNKRVKVNFILNSG
uniref:VWFD domain-containing protein n=1 Tax=Poecilia latipinna TaxID=48699 RepID=A0A3B3UB36_9TELE